MTETENKLMNTFEDRYTGACAVEAMKAISKSECTLADAMKVIGCVLDIVFVKLHDYDLKEEEKFMAEIVEIVNDRMKLLIKERMEELKTHEKR